MHIEYTADVSHIAMLVLPVPVMCLLCWWDRKDWTLSNAMRLSSILSSFVLQSVLCLVLYLTIREFETQYAVQHAPWLNALLAFIGSCVGFAIAYGVNTKSWRWT